MQQGFFLPAPGAPAGQRFGLFHPAQGGEVHGRVVYVHPFAEEMNKARRMSALQARALAAAGFIVLQIDLHGCGDSSGDFGDARWADWVADVQQAAAWLGDRDDAHLAAPLWLWGLRAGCLVAVEAAAGLGPCNFCFWQPAASGKTLLQQFLRLKSAGEMLAGGGKGVVEGLRQQLLQGQAVEIAGYTLAADMAGGLERVTLRPPAGLVPGRVEWLELSSQVGATLSPVSSQAAAFWAQAGFALRSQVLEGPAYWHTAEIEVAPLLISATVAALRSPRARP